jgi:hypothetical protein
VFGRRSSIGAAQRRVVGAFDLPFSFGTPQYKSARSLSGTCERVSDRSVHVKKYSQIKTKRQDLGSSLYP